MVSPICAWIEVLDAGVEEADLADRELLDRARLRREDAQLVDLVGPPGGHEEDLVPFAERAVDDAHHADDPAIGVVPGVEQQRLERRLGVALAAAGCRGRSRSRTSSMPIPDLAEASTASWASMPTTLSICSLTRSGSAAGRSILLITGTRSRLPFDRQVGVGERLRLHPLRGVDHQQRPLAGGEAARHLVGEVDVAGGVDQVELVGPSPSFAL